MVGRIRPFVVGVGTNETHFPASLGSKLTASSLTTWFSGGARAVYHDYGLYRYYTPTLSAIDLLCPSPRLSILYCGSWVSRVEELRLELPRCFIYSKMYLRRDLGRLLETKDLSLRISYVTRQCGPHLEPVPFGGVLIRSHRRAISTRSAQLGSESRAIFSLTKRNLRN